MTSDAHDRIIAEGTHLRLVCRQGWEFVERSNSTGVVAIVAVTDEGELLLTEQFRKPVGCRVVDLPAGLAGDMAGLETERMSAAAHRELEEEVGYRAGEMRFVFRGPSSAGLTSEVITFFRAYGLQKVAEGGGDETEDIQVHAVPLEGIEEWLTAKMRGGVAIDPKIIAGMYFSGCIYCEPTEP